VQLNTLSALFKMPSRTDTPLNQPITTAAVNIANAVRGSPKVLQATAIAARSDLRSENGVLATIREAIQIGASWMGKLFPVSTTLATPANTSLQLAQECKCISMARRRLSSNVLSRYPDILSSQSVQFMMTFIVVLPFPLRPFHPSAFSPSRRGPD
jgi:hypothetical protein